MSSQTQSVPTPECSQGKGDLFTEMILHHLCLDSKNLEAQDVLLNDCRYAQHQMNTTTRVLKEDKLEDETKNFGPDNFSPVRVTDCEGSTATRAAS